MNVASPQQHNWLIPKALRDHLLQLRHSFSVRLSEGPERELTGPASSVITRIRLSQLSC